jgi:repressor LexA
MKGLTSKQQEMLDFIDSFARREGMAPTVYEIADQFGIRSATAFAHLRALQRKGYVNRSSKARSLSLVGGTSASKSGSFMLSIPLLGHISAGSPLLAEQHIETDLSFDPKMLPRGAGGHKLFALRVFGDSMRDAGILDGDVVLAKHTGQAAIGDVVVAMVGNETTVKSLFIQNHNVELRPANSAFSSQFYAPDQVQIQGVVIALMRTF